MASTNETTGLKCPPETGPNIKMMAKSPAPVAAAFSKSWSPVSCGESVWAAMPEPMTSAARKALPRNSAVRRRHSATSVIGSAVDECGPTLRQQHAVGSAGRVAADAIPVASRLRGRVGQHRVDLPRRAVRVLHPHLVLDGVAAGRPRLFPCGEARAGEPNTRCGDLVGARHLHAEVVERAPDASAPGARCSISTSLSGGSAMAKLA